MNRIEIEQIFFEASQYTRTNGYSASAFDAYDDGFQSEIPIRGKKAKNRERSKLHIAEEMGHRERSYQMTPPPACLCGCGKLLPIDPKQKGPKRRWCSNNARQRLYIKDQRAGVPWHLQTQERTHDSAAAVQKRRLKVR